MDWQISSVHGDRVRVRYSIMQHSEVRELWEVLLYQDIIVLGSTHFREHYIIKVYILPSIK